MIALLCDFNEPNTNPWNDFSGDYSKLIRGISIKMLNQFVFTLSSVNVCKEPISVVCYLLNTKTINTLFK